MHPVSSWHHRFCKLWDGFWKWERNITFRRNEKILNLCVTLCFEIFLYFSGYNLKQFWFKMIWYTGVKANFGIIFPLKLFVRSLIVFGNMYVSTSWFFCNPQILLLRAKWQTKCKIIICVGVNLYMKMIVLLSSKHLF